MPHDPRSPKVTLSDADIATERLGRRSALMALGATLAFGVPTLARAQADSDTGVRADAAGRGRTGVTDSDTGPDADRPGHGRQRGPTGCTDRDAGRHADAAGNGRCHRCSDSDAGQFADPAGRGRRC